VSGIWIQDWSGKKSTSFGKRVYWNWQWDLSMYPHLDLEIKVCFFEGVVRDLKCKRFHTENFC